MWCFSLILVLSLCGVSSDVLAISDEDRNDDEAYCRPFSLNTHEVGTYRKGSVRMFGAFGFRKNWEAPISMLHGDLYRFGMIRMDYALSSNVMLHIRGGIRESLHLDAGQNTDDYDIQNGRAADVGDFSIAFIACLVPDTDRSPGMGFRVETRLPNTNQDRGLGPNTTDVTLSILMSKGMGTLSIFGDLGVGILTSPRQLNEQNDVLVYGLGIHWRFTRYFSLAGEINGFLSTRRSIPAGTEDRGCFRIGLAWTFDKWSLEIFPEYGLTPREGTWGVVAGIGYSFQKSVSKN
jgi:hypothetical protein